MFTQSNLSLSLHKKVQYLIQRIITIISVATTITDSANSVHVLLYDNNFNRIQ